MNGHNYEFHTAEVEGVEVVGVMFDASTGRFYEFQDPDTHDDYERFEDPRSGDVIVYDNKIAHMMADIMNGRPRVPVPADEWVEFRADYVGADDEDYDRWGRMWEDMAESDPRFDGAANA